MKPYTSLTQLKMAMNGGVLPPMTPLSEKAKAICDPAFTIGLGALTEDVNLGLRCPVRGCGRWMHKLTTHLNRTHWDIGGAEAIKIALDIPPTTKLISQHTLAPLVERKRADYAANVGLQAWSKGARSISAADRVRGVRRRASWGTVVAIRNLRNVCEEQLRHNFIDIHNKFGRSPTAVEFEDEYRGTMYHIIRLYDSWNNAKSHFGFECYKVRRTSPRGQKQRPHLRAVVRNSVALLDGLWAWYCKNGSLPTSATCRRGISSPLLHTPRTYLLAFGAASHGEAMRRAAALLNIYGGKYGLPIEHKPKEEAA